MVMTVSQAQIRWEFIKKVEGRKFHHNLLEWPERWGKKESNR